jgi:hypothetical protein
LCGRPLWTRVSSHKRSRKLLEGARGTLTRNNEGSNGIDNFLPSKRHTDNSG